MTHPPRHAEHLASPRLPPTDPGSAHPVNGRKHKRRPDETPPAFQEAIAQALYQRPDPHGLRLWPSSRPALHESNSTSGTDRSLRQNADRSQPQWSPNRPTENGQAVDHSPGDPAGPPADVRTSAPSGAASAATAVAQASVTSSTVAAASATSPAADVIPNLNTDPGVALAATGRDPLPALTGTEVSEPSGSAEPLAEPSRIPLDARLEEVTGASPGGDERASATAELTTEKLLPSTVDRSSDSTNTKPSPVRLEYGAAADRGMADASSSGEGAPQEDRRGASAAASLHQASGGASASAEHLTQQATPVTPWATMARTEPIAPAPAGSVRTAAAPRSGDGSGMTLPVEKGRDGSYQLQFDSPELGRILVQVKEVALGLRARLTASNEATHQLLAGQLDQVQAELQQAGIDVAEFSLGGQSRHTFRRPSSFHRPPPAAGQQMDPLPMPLRGTLTVQVAGRVNLLA